MPGCPSPIPARLYGWLTAALQRAQVLLLPRLRRSVVFCLLLLTVLAAPGGVLTSMTALAAPSQPKHPVARLTPTTQAEALANQAAAWGHGKNPVLPLDMVDNSVQLL